MCKNLSLLFILLKMPWLSRFWQIFGYNSIMRYLRYGEHFVLSGIKIRNRKWRRRQGEVFLRSFSGISKRQQNNQWMTKMWIGRRPNIGNFLRWVWQGRDTPLLIVYKENAMEWLTMVWYNKWYTRYAKIWILRLVKKGLKNVRSRNQGTRFWAVWPRWKIA